ncbi:MAG: XrtA-associated tyrosine autokinase [Aquabacterium sp.]|nr:XrtA-associated tyrosine autokinase [Aquabacterium sp.]
MNIIEQAAKRIEELRRAGVDVPWTATGVDQEAKPPAEVVPPPMLIEPPLMHGGPTVVALSSLSAKGDARVAPIEFPEHSDPYKPARRSRLVELDLKRLAANGFLVPGAPRTQIEAEFRVVKRPLLMNATGESAAPIVRGNLIMVTSALPGEGKTFSAINLAMSIAMELDHTVLLVDADVVRPSVLSRLGLPPAKGLLDVLTTPGTDLADVMLKTNIPKLTILPAGTANSRTTELLASGAMVDLLTELATSYKDRIVIFDAPPLLPSTESRVLATHVGQVIVVVEADQTPRPAISQAFATLEDCPVVMAVLNKCRGKVTSSAYGYYAV